MTEGAPTRVTGGVGAVAEPGWGPPREERYRPIGSCGLIGDPRTAALVGADGSIDGFRPGRFDAPSLVAEILDAGRGVLRGGAGGPVGADACALVRRVDVRGARDRITEGIMARAGARSGRPSCSTPEARCSTRATC